MSTAAVQLPPSSINIGPRVEKGIQDTSYNSHDVNTTLYYYKDPGDGSEPAPTYVGYVISRVACFTLILQ
jgi:hypothetical protein